MKKTKENPIAIQSKQWILTALLCLMVEKDFSHISIKELTLRAGLDRKTFYRNKSDYELVYQAGGFWNATIHWINGGAKETPEEMAKIIAAIMLSFPSQTVIHITYLDQYPNMSYYLGSC